MRMRVLNVCAASAMALIAAACGDGGGGGGSVTSASPTTSSVAVTLTSPIKVGDTTQASATATLSNGQSQPVSTGWQSDAASVATVTDGGLVTGIGNGRATIFVLSGGRQGQQVIRVVPDFQGQWSGGLRVTSCTESGVFATVGFCRELAVGITDGFGLAVTQSGESVTATPNYGSSFTVAPATGAVSAEGIVSFNALITGSSGLTLDTTWRVSSPSRGVLAGTVSEVWRLPGVTGEGRLEQDIVQTSRTSTTATPSSARARAMGRVKALRGKTKGRLAAAL